MATDLFLTDVASDVVATGNELIANIGVRGDAGVTVSTTNTSASGSLIQCTDTAGGTVLVWYSPPLAAVTISGTMTFNVWMDESSMSANAQAYVEIARCDETGAFISNIGGSAFGTELGTSRAAQNWTLAPTSTALSDRDRLRIIVRITNIGTMGGGFNCTMGYDGPTASADGDTYARFTETLTPAPPMTVAASDTPTASVTDASTDVLGLTVAVDAPTAGATEGTSNVSATVSRTDTPTLSVADVTTTLAGTLTTSDTPTLSLGTESSAVLVPRAGTDTPTGAFTETTAVKNLPTAVDAPALASTEGTSVILGSLSRTDTPTVSFTEAQVSALTVSRTDTPTLSVADVSSILGVVAVSDVPTLSLVDVGALIAIVPVADGLDMAVIDEALVLALTVAVDSPALSLSEANDIFAITVDLMSSTDSLLLGLDEANATVVTVGRSDSLTLSLTDVTTTLIGILSRSDTPTISLAEAQQSLLIVGTDDSLRGLWSDVSALMISRAVTDTITIGAGFEIVNLLKAVVVGTDTGGLVGTEGTSLLLVKVLVANTLTVGVTDVSFLLAQQYSSEVIWWSLAEQKTLTGTMATADTMALSSPEAAVVLALTVGVDSTVLSMVGATPTIQTGVTVSDTAGLVAAEGYLIAVGVTASGGIALGLIEDRVLGGDYPVLDFMTASDVLLLTGVEVPQNIPHGVRGRAILSDMRAMEEIPMDKVMEDTAMSTMG